MDIKCRDTFAITKLTSSADLAILQNKKIHNRSDWRRGVDDGRGVVKSAIDADKPISRLFLNQRESHPQIPGGVNTISKY